MKKYALMVLVLACCAASLAFASDERFSKSRPDHPKGYSQAPHDVIQTGGDTFGTATVIPALPYSDAGNTCQYADNYSPACAYSVAPDVVYAFRPTADMCVNVSLCGSGYDTVVGIYQNDPSTLIACDDDSDCGLQSKLTSVPLTAGNTYYIVVDGYSSACGDYTLSVTQCEPPPVCPPCPAASIQEGEVTCSSGYVDNFDGGCNSSPEVYRHLACAPTQSICGTYGTFDDNSTRDTDWYDIVLTAPTNLTVTVTGGGLTGSAVAILDTSCPPNVFCGQFTPGVACAPVTCTAALAPGTYHIFTASFFDNTPCGTPYVMTVSGLDCPTPTHTKTWGTLKAIYR